LLPSEMKSHTRVWTATYFLIKTGREFFKMERATECVRKMVHCPRQSHIVQVCTDRNRSNKFHMSFSEIFRNQ